MRSMMRGLRILEYHVINVIGGSSLLMVVVSNSYCCDLKQPGKEIARTVDEMLFDEMLL